MSKIADREIEAKEFNDKEILEMFDGPNNRLKYNLKLLDNLLLLVYNNPEMRFGQILENFRYVTNDRDYSNGCNWEFEFYLESCKLLERVVKYNE